METMNNVEQNKTSPELEKIFEDIINKEESATMSTDVEPSFRFRRFIEGVTKKVMRCTKFVFYTFASGQLIYWGLFYLPYSFFTSKSISSMWKFTGVWVVACFALQVTFTAAKKITSGIIDSIDVKLDTVNNTVQNPSAVLESITQRQSGNPEYKDSHIDDKNLAIIRNKTSGNDLLSVLNPEAKWLDKVRKLPFTKQKHNRFFKISCPTELQEQIENISNILDDLVYKLTHVKKEIIDYLIFQETLRQNKQQKTTLNRVLALCGSAGVGKTRLIKNALAKALGRQVFTINLAGMKDVSILTGHSKTYHGSTYGLIADILMRAECSDCIIYLDEIDKIPENGIEVQRCLTHILDPEQNHAFQDAFFNGIDIDLSNVLFIASMNNVNNIDPILKDRLEIVFIDEMTHQDKVVIVKDYLVPEIVKSLPYKLKFDDNIWEKLIWSKMEEPSNRQVKNMVSYLITKINRLVLTNKLEILDGAYRITSDTAEELLTDCNWNKANNFAAMHFYT